LFVFSSSEQIKKIQLKVKEHESKLEEYQALLQGNKTHNL